MLWSSVKQCFFKNKFHLSSKVNLAKKQKKTTKKEKVIHTIYHNNLSVIYSLILKTTSRTLSKTVSESIL